MRWPSALLAFFVAALAVRVAGVVVLGDTQPDGYEHGTIAENLLAGRGFSIGLLGQFGPTAQQGPLYPGGLAALYAVFGVRSPTAFVVLQLLQCVAGAAIVPLVARISWSLWPERRGLGWLAAILAAVHPAHIYMVTHVQVVTWVALLLSILAAIALSGAIGSTRTAFATGIAAAALLLLEPILLLALPWMAAGWWNRAGRQHEVSRGMRARQLAWVCAAAVMVLAPWLMRNAVVFREPVFVKSTFGYAFWQGNNPASWGTDKLPVTAAESLRLQHDGSWAGRHEALGAARQETLYIDDMQLRPHGYRELAGLTEPQRSRALGRQALQFVREHPKHYAWLCLQRLRYFLLFDETNPKAADPLYRATTTVWLVLVGIGLLARPDGWRRTWPLLGAVISVGLFHVLTITSVRFRLPLEPLTLIWAAEVLWPAATLLGRMRMNRSAPADEPVAMPPTAPAVPLRKAA